MNPLQNLMLACATVFYWVATTLNRYSFAIGLRRRVKLPGITISIGNIAVGGTGKSPVVLEVAKYLLSIGKQPAILTRGYRSGLRESEWLMLLDGKIVAGKGSFQEFFGDEAMMQSNLLPSVPVIVGAKRAAAAQWALANALVAPSHWILDDGFQHWPIIRDFDVVLLDFAQPFGHNHLLPLGRLRERPSALQRADLVVFTRAGSTKDYEQTDDFQRVRSSFAGPVAFAAFTNSQAQLVDGTSNREIDAKAHRFLVAVGTANPDAVVEQFKRLGLNIAREYIIDDHCRFDFDLLQKKFVGCTAILTTEKDYWRESDIFTKITNAVYVSKLAVDFTPPSIFSFIPMSE
jgi:tetraacyldisaccharide 4'-kinase